MKTLIPHMMADREEVEDDWDDWFGFFRLNMQPKPVAVAHAVSAERLDSSRYVGELDYGSYVGAFLFERNGVFTLALWSGEDRDKTLDLNVGVPELTQVDLMGRKKSVQTRDGKLPITLSPSTTYLVGVSPEMEKSVIPSDAPLNPDWWAERSGKQYTVPHMRTAPLVDGNLKDWAAVAPLVGKSGQPVPEDQTTVWLSWDDQYLYIAADVNDNEVIVQEKSGSSDALQINVGADPGRQTDMPSKALYDYLIVLTPAAGRPERYSVTHAGWLQPVSGTSKGGKGGVKYASQKTSSGWTVEAAVPLSLMKGFPSPPGGKKISGEVLLFDSNGKGAANKKPLLGEGGRPATWPYLQLLKN